MGAEELAKRMKKRRESGAGSKAAKAVAAKSNNSGKDEIATKTNDRGTRNGDARIEGNESKRSDPDEGRNSKRSGKDRDNESRTNRRAPKKDSDVESDRKDAETGRGSRGR